MIKVTPLKNLKSIKSGVIHEAVKAISGYTDVLCGSVWQISVSVRGGRYVMTNQEVTCKLCLRQIKKREAEAKAQENSVRYKKLNVEVIKSFKTSDGLVFENEEKAFAYEESLESKRMERVFKTYIRKQLNNPDDDEEDLILEGMHLGMSIAGQVIESVDDFSTLLWELFRDGEELITNALKKFKVLNKK